MDHRDYGWKNNLQTRSLLVTLELLSWRPSQTQKQCSQIYVTKMHTSITYLVKGPKIIKFYHFRIDPSCKNQSLWIKWAYRFPLRMHQALELGKKEKMKNYSSYDFSENQSDSSVTVNLLLLVQNLQVSHTMCTFSALLLLFFKQNQGLCWFKA